MNSDAAAAAGSRFLTELITPDGAGLKARSDRHLRDCALTQVEMKANLPRPSQRTKLTVAAQLARNPKLPSPLRQSLQTMHDAPPPFTQKDRYAEWKLEISGLIEQAEDQLQPQLFQQGLRESVTHSCRHPLFYLFFATVLRASIQRSAIPGKMLSGSQQLAGDRGCERRWPCQTRALGGKEAQRGGW
jgi:hypothetical protein